MNYYIKTTFDLRHRYCMIWEVDNDFTECKLICNTLGEKVDGTWACIDKDGVLGVGGVNKEVDYQVLTKDEIFLEMI